MHLSAVVSPRLLPSNHHTYRLLSDPLDRRLRKKTATASGSSTLPSLTAVVSNHVLNLTPGNYENLQIQSDNVG